MIPIFHILVIAFILLTAFFFMKQKQKGLITLMGILTGVIGIFIEVNGVATSDWSWSNSVSVMLGVPYIVLLVYFLTGILVASLALNLNVKKSVDSLDNKLYIPLLIFGIIYFIVSREIVLTVLILAVWLYSKYHKDTYSLKISLIFAILDVIFENILIYLGYLTYIIEYDGAIYLGAFVGVWFIMSLTHYLENR